MSATLRFDAMPDVVIECTPEEAAEIVLRMGGCATPAPSRVLGRGFRYAWTREEDSALSDMRDRGLSYDTIAPTLGRTVAASQQRWSKLRRRRARGPT